MKKSLKIEETMYPSEEGVYTITGSPTKAEFMTKMDKSVESIESASSDTSEENVKLKLEKWYSITLQVFVPFFLAGMGTIGAGIVMDDVSRRPVFIEISALLVLVPALLGLKGNLDMCLASRLSTQANLGNMTSKKELFKMISGNMMLVQVQAIVASCLVSVFATAASAVLDGKFEWKHTLLLATSSTLTATLSCFILDIVLVLVIMVSHRMNLNPDNVATPMAASIGDVVSLIVLATWAGLLYDVHDQYAWVMMTIMGVYLVIFLPLWIYLVRKNKYTCKILSDGWTPVLCALLISGSGGLVLDSAVRKFDGYALFQPIINGIGGNLVSVQASRISTMFHSTSIKGVIPPHTKQWVAPWTALFKGVLPAKTAKLLIAMSIPGQIVFVIVADVINHGQLTVSAEFVLTYLFVSLLQLSMLLYIAHLMTHLMWKMKMDPDNSAIPYLTALGDLLGSTLLLLGFIFLASIGKGFNSRLSLSSE